MSNIGKLTFIKDGKKECEFYSDDETKDAIGYMYEQADKKVEEGYTVIINLKETNSIKRSSLSFNQSEVLVPEKIKNQDYILIMDKVKQDFERIKSIVITNYCERYGYKDYDYYDYNLNMYEISDDMDSAQRYYCQRDNEERTPDKILDLFLRKKLNGLTSKEEKMYYLYEDFNLETLLCDDNTSFALNNGNSGVITIFEDEIYKSTVTKMAHIDENKQHINAYMESNGIKEDINNIFIQITSGYVACWLPTKINEYQSEKLNEVLNEVEDIKTLRGNIKLFGAVIDNNDKSNIMEEFYSIKAIKEYINKQSEKSK